MFVLSTVGTKTTNSGPKCSLSEFLLLVSEDGSRTGQPRLDSFLFFFLSFKIYFILFEFGFVLRYIALAILKLAA